MRSAVVPPWGDEGRIQGHPDRTSGTIFAVIETGNYHTTTIMKRILLCLLCFMSLSAYAQHTVVVNPDGTHSIAIQTGSSTTIVNPDGTHSTGIQTGNTTTIVNPDGTHSTAIHNGNIITIVNPDGTHSTAIHNGNIITIVNPDGTHTTAIENGNDITIANPKGRSIRKTLKSIGKKKSSKKHDRKHTETDL